MHSIKLNIS